MATQNTVREAGYVPSDLFLQLTPFALATHGNSEIIAEDNSKMLKTNLVAQSQ